MLGQLPIASNYYDEGIVPNPPMAPATHKQIQIGERKIGSGTGNRYAMYLYSYLINDIYTIDQWFLTFSTQFPVFQLPVWIFPLLHAMSFGPLLSTPYQSATTPRNTVGALRLAYWALCIRYKTNYIVLPHKTQRFGMSEWRIRFFPLKFSDSP